MNTFRSAKLIFFLLLVLGLTVTGGCGTGTEASSGDQGGNKEQVQEQEQPDKNDQEPGGLASFQTKDIYGNDVNQDIFKDYSLTLVNVWGTFCGPCLEEMPYLGELQKEYEPKGVNIVGIVVDVQDEDMQIIDDQIKLARDIADRTGANYTHMIVSNEMIDSVLNKFDAIPASFFVDKYGNIVSEFYVGSRSKKDWVDLIETNIKNQK
jgi:thiol-disulfide isomerase/thioredoxin